MVAFLILKHASDVSPLNALNHSKPLIWNIGAEEGDVIPSESVDTNRTKKGKKRRNPVD